ncbi:MAG TPA: ornithine cyclodeaminase family protein, partial [Actinospica sp.]|nr:ornithine cyclodeaminase family protein [Actinospica sp.]
AGHGSLLGTMPCHVEPVDGAAGAGYGGYGVKAMVLQPENPARGLDLHAGVVLVFDQDTGYPAALLDAGAVTALRTAAVSAVATDVLARQDCTALGILGSGVQARSHLRSMLAVRPGIREIRIWSRTPAHAEAMCGFARAEAAVREAGIEVRRAGAVAEALRGADLVCTTLACREPVVEAGMLTPGVHVNAVGASFRDHREFTAAAVARARLFVDSRESALNESGDIGVPLREGLIGAEHILAEIGEVLLGKQPGRGGPEEITMYKSLGLAVQDVMFGFAAAAAANRSLAGTEVQLDR